jgi:glycosyltransferase involved in cell wall biosynthesis
MRVLHVVPSLSTRTGGPAVAVARTASALRSRGVTTTIFATDMGRAVSAPHRAVTDADLPPGLDGIDVRLFPARPPHRMAFAPAMLNALREETRRYDLVHIHSLFLFPQFAAFQQARRAGVPYIVSPRGALDPHMRARNSGVKMLAHALWQRAMLENAAALHFTSYEEARLAASIASRTSRAVVPNGIDWQSYQRLPDARLFRERRLHGHDGPVVLYMGRLSHKKGVDVLIRAFALVLNGAPRATLVIAGPDDERLTPALARLAEAEGIEGRVVFAGMLTGDERLEALAAADVWALPSRTENFANALVEEMAAGRACVISPGVNIAPAITGAAAARVVEAAPQPLATAISRLLADPAECSAIGERARQFARRYDWDAVAPDLIDMYVRCIAGAAVAA